MSPYINIDIPVYIFVYTYIYTHTHIRIHHVLILEVPSIEGPSSKIRMTHAHI